MPEFSGEFGGLMAMAWGAGFICAWTLCVKIMVKPLEKRLSHEETKLEEINKRIAARFWAQSRLPSDGPSSLE